MADDEDGIICEVEVPEFEYGTSVILMNDGTARLRLAAFPPSWPHQPGAFDTLSADLAAVLGTTVTGLDKELFVISAADANTLQVVSAYLVDLRLRIEVPSGV